MTIHDYLENTNLDDQQKYYRRNKERVYLKSEAWHATNKAKVAQSKAKHYRENRDAMLQKAKIRNDGLRLAAISVLGGICIKCGYSDERTLQFNHINGDGFKDRRTNRQYRIYKDVADGRRSDIELTCANCNAIHARENRLLGGKKRQR